MILVILLDALPPLFSASFLIIGAPLSFLTLSLIPPPLPPFLASLGFLLCSLPPSSLPQSNKHDGTYAKGLLDNLAVFCPKHVAEGGAESQHEDVD